MSGKKMCSCAGTGKGSWENIVSLISEGGIKRMAKVGWELAGPVGINIWNTWDTADARKRTWESGLFQRQHPPEHKKILDGPSFRSLKGSKVEKQGFNPT